MTMDVWEAKRGQWVQALGMVDKAMLTGDAVTVKRLARSLGATYAIVGWPVADAVYSDEYYSILKVD
jgi:hypothetical protein